MIEIRTHEAGVISVEGNGSYRSGPGPSHQFEHVRLTAGECRIKISADEARQLAAVLTACASLAERKTERERKCEARRKAG